MSSSFSSFGGSSSFSASFGGTDNPEDMPDVSGVEGDPDPGPSVSAFTAGSLPKPPAEVDVNDQELPEGLFSGEGKGMVTLTEYDLLLCHLSDVKPGFGQLVHNLLSPLNNSEWILIQPILTGLSRGAIKPKRDWVFVEPANRVRTVKTAAPIDPGVASLGQIARALSAYPGQKFVAKGDGLYCGDQRTTGDTYGILEEKVPGVSGGFLTYPTETAVKLVAKRIVDDYIRAEPAYPITGKFKSGESLYTNQSVGLFIKKSYNGPNFEADKMLAKFHTAWHKANWEKVLKSVTGNRLGGNMIKHDDHGFFWSLPKDMQAEFLSVKANSLEVLNDCRSIRGKDNDDVEKSTWYRSIHCPKTLMEIANYTEIIGAEQKLTILGGNKDHDNYFSTISLGEETQMLVVFDGHYNGRFNRDDLAERGFPPAAVYSKHLAEYKNKKVFLAASIPTTDQGWEKLYNMMRNGWFFFPGTSPHNGRFWITNQKERGGNLSMLIAWLRLGIVVNHLRTITFLGLVPSVALNLRRMISRLYGAFEVDVELKTPGILFDWMWKEDDHETPELEMPQKKKKKEDDGVLAMKT